MLKIFPLTFPFACVDPFLFAVHHKDAYPPGNLDLGPPQSALLGRNLGEDFTLQDGFRMYHGQTVPGFPSHPHRGFETITIVRQGFVDHADSLSAAGRFGAGDVQWMTAGRGIIHSEMFPLLHSTEENPVELFQIWLNLKSADKLAEPYFSMLWNSTIPVYKTLEGPSAEVRIIAGQFADLKAPAPPPHSWAAYAESDVAIWSILLEPNARITLPRANTGTTRTLYSFRGTTLEVNRESVPAYHGVSLPGDSEVLLTGGPDLTEVLLLQGKPLGEPVVQYGPFVMNSHAEIEEAFRDYQRGRFGIWPWPKADPVHGREALRFARYADGRVEQA